MKRKPFTREDILARGHPQWLAETLFVWICKFLGSRIGWQRLIELVSITYFELYGDRAARVGTPYGTEKTAKGKYLL